MRKFLMVLVTLYASNVVSAASTTIIKTGDVLATGDRVTKIAVTAVNDSSGEDGDGGAWIRIGPILNCVGNRPNK